jgi:hypothetical protein
MAYKDKNPWPPYTVNCFTDGLDHGGWRGDELWDAKRDKHDGYIGDMQDEDQIDSIYTMWEIMYGEA